MLGWDVGTFEFTSDKITTKDWTSNTKLKMRTGGSSGVIPRTQCRSLHEGGNGVFWDIAKKDGKNNVRLPVKYRYRSPVVFEFHVTGKRGAAAYAMLWLQHLVDNEDTEIDLPIWTTKNGRRLIQNYITEENARARTAPGLEDLQEVGRLQFRARFKAGMDEDHERFVVDDDSRETYETFEACLAEGVRHRIVEPEVPEHIQELHEKSLTEGRDVLSDLSPEEREKWIAKNGEDWSGAFGHDPRAYMDSAGRKRAEPGSGKPHRDPIIPGETADNLGAASEDEDSFSNSDDDDDDDDTPTSSQTGPTASITGLSPSTYSQWVGTQPQQSAQSTTNTTTSTSPSHHHDQQPADALARQSNDALTTQDSAKISKDQQTAQGVLPNGSGPTNPNLSKSQTEKLRANTNKKSEKRKQRGLMQWKPVRNMAFAKDEAKFALRKVRHKFGGDLTGREPDVETEMGT